MNAQPQPAPSVVHAHLSSAQAEAIETIAGRLIALRPESGRLAFVVCGVARGDGATFMAAHLAMAIANSGYSTLLVDADLESPGLEAFIPGAPDVPGLVDLLSTGDLAPGEVMQPGPEASLTVVHAGQVKPRAIELVATAKFEAFIADCVRTYEFTIVDAPPANRTSQTVMIVDVVGSALIVARQDLSYMDDVAMLTKSITEAGATVLGAALIEP